MKWIKRSFIINTVKFKPVEGRIFCFYFIAILRFKIHLVSIINSDSWNKIKTMWSPFSKLC